MPGLKALTDRLPAGDTSRAVTLYTSSFSVGVGLSFLVAQILADRWGWRTAFYITGIGPIAMVVDSQDGHNFSRRFANLGGARRPIKIFY